MDKKELREEGITLEDSGVNPPPEVTVKERKLYKLPVNILFILLGVVIFSGSMIAAAWLISNTGFSIRSTGTVGAGGVSQVDSVAVNGVGEILVKPDTATIRVSAREEARNAQEAQEKLNRKVNLLMDAIQKAGVKKDDITTNSYSAYQYRWWDWNDTNERTVYQSFQVKVRGIDTNEKILGNVVDAIIDVDAQTGWYIGFELEDKTEAYSQARELAYEKALQKAEELGDISGIKLGDVRYINDQSRDTFTSDYEESPSAAKYDMVGAQEATDSSTNIPVGDIQVRVELDVQFEIL